MSRLIIGIGMFLDGSLCLCSLFGETSSLAGTLVILLVSTLFTSIIVNWATMVWEAEQQPAVLGKEKSEINLRQWATEFQSPAERVVEEVPLRSVSGQPDL